MSTYTRSQSKPDKLLTGYISVRAPELKHIYHSLQETTSVSEVAKKFGRPSIKGVERDHIEDTLRFLSAVDLVDSPTGDVTDTVERINDELFDDLPFEARLLYNCNQQEGRQSHFAGIYRALMSAGTRVIDSDRDEVRTLLKRETPFEFEWTDEKINMWVTLCEQLGLISETDDGILLSPCRALLHDALLVAPRQEDETPSYSESVEDGEFYRALNWVNDNLFTVFQARTGTPLVHPAIADVLRNMEADGVLTLSAPGDARNEVKLPPTDLSKNVRGNRQSVTHFSLDSRPSETAYQYPLDQVVIHK
ncbi:hypothetical protein [Haladaptatus sp. ZSTT2]|uniref:hypothetical protein n=1 Tax=Haladaptatus sp. ZSTT2 TaxID=3120515 RepID=UPI00300F039D